MSADLIPFNRLPALLPGRPNLSTLHRWRLRGVAGVKLGVTYIGGRVYVDPDELDRFFQSVNSAKNGMAPPARTDRQRDRAVTAAEQELARAGF